MNLLINVCLWVALCYLVFEKKKKKTKREKKVVLIVFSAASQILQTRSFNPCCFYLYIHIQQKKSLFFFYIFSHNKKWGFNPHSFHHQIHHHFCFFSMLIQSVCAVLSTSLRRSVVWLFVNLLGVSSFLWILSLALHCRLQLLSSPPLPLHFSCHVYFCLSA